MEKSKFRHVIIDVPNMMEICMHFQGSLPQGLTTVSNTLEKVAGWLSGLISFFPFNNSQYANTCLSERCTLTLPSWAGAVPISSTELVLLGS